MSSAGRILGRLHRPPVRHIQHFFSSTHRLGLGFRQSQPFAIHHHRNLTTSFPSRSAKPPTRIYIPDPYSDDALGKPLPEDLRRQIAEWKRDDGQLWLDGMRDVALTMIPLSFLLANFPEEDGFRYIDVGPLPRDIKYIDKDVPMTIPRDETYLYAAARAGDPNARIEGRKQGGIVCFVLSVVPPGGFAESSWTPRPAGPLVNGTAETPGLHAAEKALLEFVREIQGVGYQQAPPLGESVEGCMVVVFLRELILVYDYSRERGFFDPPGGHEFVGKKVDPARLYAPPVHSSS